MKIEIKIDQERSLIQFFIIGEILYLEIIEIINSISNDNNTVDMNILCDLSSTNMFNITPVQIQQIAIIMGDNWKDWLKGKIAIVTSKEYDFGMTRMFEIYIETKISGELKVFRSSEQAISWFKLNEKYQFMNDL